MAKVYIFEISLTHFRPKISRRIAIRGDQTLHDLFYAIERAFERDADHLYSFYIGVGKGTTRRRFDQAAEYVHPFSDSGEPAEEVTIDELNLERTTKMEYLFDYGAEWWHKMKLVKVEELKDPDAKYPQIIAKVGDAPQQYPDYEE